METNCKLSRTEKARLIFRYLRDCWGHFVAAIGCACLAMVFGAVTPQIIRLTVDSILGDESAALPVFVQNLIGWETLRQSPGQALLLAAAAVLIVAALRGVCSYGQRIELA